MKRRLIHRYFAISMILICSAVNTGAQSQSAKQKTFAKQQTGSSGGAQSPVVGGGTIGRLPKWTGFTSTNSMIGDTSIFEDKFGKVGIGTDTPTSPLTVQGMIETTLGGIKFPDGTVQTTAALSPSQVVRSLNGLMGDLTLQAGANIIITASGNTLTIAAPNSLSAVTHNSTLTGNGTSVSPLGIALPLLLRGSSSPQPILTVQNDGFGFAIQGNGTDQNGLAGYSNTADGTSGQTNGANHSGVLGVNTNGAGWGVKGTNTSNNNFGYLGGPANGVYGFSSGGNGVTGESSTGLAGNFIGNVTVSGSLGIGTTPSGSKLAVAGLIQSITDGFKFPDGTIQTTAASSASGNFIQNTTTQQPNSNFNISGSGTAAGELHATVVTADAFFKIANHKMLSLANDADPDSSTNMAVGIGAGSSNGAFQSTPTGNTFIGRDAGHDNTAARENTFVGFQAGMHNSVTGNVIFPDANANTFIGYQAGLNNDGTGVNVGSGAENTFVGHSSGKANVDGGRNSFFGKDAGLHNGGDGNTFLGYGAGKANTGEPQSLNGQGSNNTFVGRGAGQTNTTGNKNTAIGYQADVAGADLSFATAIGAGAVVSSSDTIALGRSDGSDTVEVPGKLQLDTLAVAGSTQLCLNSSNRVGSCSSSLRYKTGIQPFISGLDVINRLHPITFTWKTDGKRDVGFGAEDVQKIEPLLVTLNSIGQVEGVKYDRITAVLVNAIKEQQQQLVAQQTQLEELKTIRRENDELKARLVNLTVRIEQIEKANRY
jgi:trimeric autotransporter adhesin